MKSSRGCQKCESQCTSKKHLAISRSPPLPGLLEPLRVELAKPLQHNRSQPSSTASTPRLLRDGAVLLAIDRRPGPTFAKRFSSNFGHRHKLVLLLEDVEHQLFLSAAAYIRSGVQTPRKTSVNVWRTTMRTCAA